MGKVGGLGFWVLQKKKTFCKEERWDRAGVFLGPESALRGEKRRVVVTLDWRTRVWFMKGILVI